MPHRLPTLRVRLLLLVIAFSGPMLVFEAWQAAQERRAAVEAARANMLQLAHTAAALEDDSLQEASNLLRVLVRVQAVGSAGDGECHALLREIINEHPRVRSITVVREDGSIECTGSHPVPLVMNFTDRPWFKAASAADAPAVVVSRFLISRMTGEPTVIVAGGMRSGGPGTRTDRVVAISLNLAWLSEMAARLPGLSGATIVVMDARDGMVLARSVDAANWVGRAFPDHPLVQAFRGSSEGAVELAGIDGVVRLTGFTRLPGSPETSMLVAVGVPTETVVSSLDRRLLQSLGVIALLALVGFALSSLIADRLLIRPLRKLNTMALGMARGDLSIRLDPRSLDVREFLLLGETLNHAAAQIEERDRRLDELATRDGLTGLLNRRCFDQRIAEEWARAERAGTPLAVAMIDVDRFKLLNDTYGHAIGDERLRQIARTLEGALRCPSDLSARYGGEEFVVVLTNTGLDNAVRVAERLVQTIEALRLPSAGSEWGVVTVSVGVAAVMGGCSGGLTPGHLVAAADAALYQAKMAGRNRALAAPALLADVLANAD